MSDYTDRTAAWDRGEDTSAECPKCYGSGTLGWNGEFGAGMQLIKCDCQAVKVPARRGGLTGYDTQTFDTFTMLPSVARQAQRCYDYSLNPTNWLLLAGPVGTGKSHLSAAIANAVAARGASVYFATVPDLLEDLKSALDGREGERYIDRLNRIRNVGLLVLDDFGTESATPWSFEKIFQIINHRYQRKLPTVISTNLSPKTFDPRIASRLGDVVLVEVLQFGGAEDFRNLPPSRRVA